MVDSRQLTLLPHGGLSQEMQINVGGAQAAQSFIDLQKPLLRKNWREIQQHVALKVHAVVS